MVTPQELLLRVGDHPDIGDTRLPDVHIGRLRSTLDHDPSAPMHIATVRGLGHRFDRRPAGPRPAGAVDESARVVPSRAVFHLQTLGRAMPEQCHRAPHGPGAHLCQCSPTTEEPDVLRGVFSAETAVPPAGGLGSADACRHWRSMATASGTTSP